jgi:hypothetical protein
MNDVFVRCDAYLRVEGTNMCNTFLEHYCGNIMLTAYVELERVDHHSRQIGMAANSASLAVTGNSMTVELCELSFEKFSLAFAIYCYLNVQRFTSIKYIKFNLLPHRK